MGRAAGPRRLERFGGFRFNSIGLVVNPFLKQKKICKGLRVELW